MTVQIRLGDVRPSEIVPDPLGRSVLGWEPGLDQATVWGRSYGLWVCNPEKVLEDGVIRFVNTGDIVLCVAKITGYTTFDTKPEKRHAFHGVVIADHPEVGLRTPTPHPRGQNPVHFPDRRRP